MKQRKKHSGLIKVPKSTTTLSNPNMKKYIIILNPEFAILYVILLPLMPLK